MEARRRRVARATKILSDSGDRVFCEGCMQWRSARGFVMHGCCVEGDCEDVDRMMSFAAAQITTTTKAWMQYAKYSRIPDFVVSSAPGHLRCHLRAIQRGDVR